MMNFTVNGASYGVVFSYQPVTIPHPRKGLLSSDMVVATLFDMNGIRSVGWAVRSQKDTADDVRGMKEAFGRAVKLAFTRDELKARESMWKQFQMALTREAKQAAELEREVDGLIHDIQDLVETLNPNWTGYVVPISSNAVTTATAGPDVSVTTTQVKSENATPTAEPFVTGVDPADETTPVAVG